MATIDNDSFYGSGKSQLKTWKGFTILCAIKIVHDSWKEVKISTLTGVWKKLTSTLMNELWGFETSVEEVTADEAKLARDLETEVESEDVIELRESPYKTSTDKELLIMNEQRKWFLEKKSTSGTDSIRIVEIITGGIQLEKGSKGNWTLSSIKWLISQEAAASYSRGLQNFSKGINTPPTWVGGAGETRPCVIEVKNAKGIGAGRERSDSLAWGKKRLDGWWTYSKCTKLGSRSVTLRNHPVCPTPRLM